MQANWIWWEKTIEYKFIMDSSRLRRLEFAAPLSGIQERAADGIFAKDAKIVLIEFKRSAAELDSEKTKFKNYEIAEKALNKCDGHHFLVYGSSEKQEAELKLHAQTFFSRAPIESIFGLLDCGIEPAAFEKYLIQLIKCKKDDRRSSGKVGPESFACVIGVSENGASAISFSEYCRRSLTLNQMLNPAPSSSSSSPSP